MKYKITPILTHHHEAEVIIADGDEEMHSAFRTLAEIGAACVETHPTEDKKIMVLYPARYIKKILCEAIGE